MTPPPTLHVVSAALKGANPSLKEVPLLVERSKLARRLWRGVAADGVEFGYDGEAPLAHGDVLLVTGTSRYVVRQLPERLLEIPLDIEPNAAAWIGWIVGNLHMPIEVQYARVLVPDEKPVRTALDRIGAHYHLVLDVLQPHRSAGGFEGHGHGHGHDGDVGHEHPAAAPVPVGEPLGAGTG